MLSDETLIARVARRDPGAFEMLYDRHAAAVLGVCLKTSGDRILAEQILQETFWQVWRSASTYDPRRGSFAGWLFRLARNLTLDASRGRPANIGQETTSF